MTKKGFTPYNLKCLNPYCSNQVITTSRKFRKMFCKACDYMYNKGKDVRYQKAYWRKYHERKRKTVRKSGYN